MEPICDTETTLAQLREQVAAFVKARDWEPFHNAKNISMALAAEAGELMEPFLWLKPDEVEALLKQPDKREQVEDELADVLAYALAFANATGIDLSQALARKMAKNDAKYPADMVRGRADKYTQL